MSGFIAMIAGPDPAFEGTPPPTLWANDLSTTGPGRNRAPSARLRPPDRANLHSPAKSGASERCRTITGGTA